MDYFVQNDKVVTYHIRKEAVEGNCFLNQEPQQIVLPKFEEVKDRLPAPVWEGHEAALDCYWKAWELAFGNLNNPAPGTGFISPFIDTAFNGCLFMWDSSFILMFGKYADRIFDFQGTLNNFYSHQHMDGFICREIDEKTGRDRFMRPEVSSTGPDIMAWCEWEYFLNFGNKERLAKVFPPLMAYHRWMAENHTWPDGTYFSSGWGCGMDNLPRQAAGYTVGISHGHMIWVDACMQELNNCHILIQMAKTLRQEEYIPELEAERDLLEKVINEKLWDEKTGFYYDLWRNGEHNMVRHVGAFWALIAQCASPERAARMMDYLNDEAEFKTPLRVPSLSRSHEKYNPTGEYWCGGVWAPTTYMVMKGLDKYNNYALSHEIGMEFLYAVVEVFKKKGTVFENYAPEYVDNGTPSQGSPAKGDFVGWTGLVPISVLFEYVFGIKPDASANKIVWDVTLLEKHGVERYPFGVSGEMSLSCEARANADEKPEITVTSNVPVTVEVIWGSEGNKQSFTIQA